MFAGVWPFLVGFACNLVRCHPGNPYRALASTGATRCTFEAFLTTMVMFILWNQKKNIKLYKGCISTLKFENQHHVYIIFCPVCVFSIGPVVSPWFHPVSMAAGSLARHSSTRGPWWLSWRSFLSEISCGPAELWEQLRGKKIGNWKEWSNIGLIHWWTF